MDNGEAQPSGEATTGPPLMLETRFGALIFRSNSSDSLCSDVTVLSSSASEADEWVYGNARDAEDGVAEEWWEKDTDEGMKSEGGEAESEGDSREGGEGNAEGDNDGREEPHSGSLGDRDPDEGPLESASDPMLDLGRMNIPDGPVVSPASSCKPGMDSRSDNDGEDMSEIRLAAAMDRPIPETSDQEQPNGPESGRIERSGSRSEIDNKPSSDQESFPSSSKDEAIPCNCCQPTGLWVHNRGCACRNDFYWSILQWGNRKRKLARSPQEYMRLLREASVYVGCTATKSGSFLFQLARLIERGDGGAPKNVSVAIFLYCEAIRQECWEALVYLARLAEFGTKDIRLSVSRARNLYRRVARLGGLGALYAKAYLVNGSPMSLGMFIEASKQGDVHALLNVADYFFYDNSRPPRSAFIARDLYAEVARLKHCSFCLKEALFSTAYIMEDEREDVQQDVQESVRLYESLTKQGHTESFYRLGLILHYGKDSISRNEKKAVKLYKIATRRSHFPDPPYRLGKIYQQGGKGVPQDLVAAEHYFSVAGKRGRGKAYYLLGEMFQFGTYGCAVDGAKAEKYYRLALEHDYLKAKYNLAWLLSLGYKGASKNMEEALRLCREAGDSGCAGCLRLLGDSYMSGVGVPQDVGKAYSLLRRSAEAGDQYSLVSLAFYHVGVPEAEKAPTQPINGLESERLFRIGVGNRLADAAYGLGYLHEVGFGEHGKAPNVCRSLHSIRSRIEIGEESGQPAFEEITQGPVRDGEECVQFYRIAGRRGHDRSLYRLAMVMNNHDDIPRNAVQTVRLLRMAVESGNVNAPYVLGQILKHGDMGVARNAVEAASVFRTGVARGDAKSAYELGVMLEEGDEGVAQDFEEALAMYHKAMEGGNVIAMVTLGDIYKLGGAGVSVDMKKAMELYSLAAENGDVDAMIELATLHRAGAEGVSINRDEARMYYRMAYEHGHIFSMLSLADMEEEDGHPKEAYQDYEIAYYKEGILEGALRLSYLLLEGEEGVEEDAPRAVELLRSCIRGGMASSQITLGNVVETGAKGVPKNPVEAAALYQAAIQDGVVDAYMFLGKLKERGDDGVPKDPVGAVYCYRRGIENGSASSAYWLANLLERGDEGVDKDVKEALTLYNNAAEQGDELAMHRLGEIWENGLYGMQKNNVKAFELYTKAVSVGNFDSLCNLGFLLFRGGDGIERDRERGERYLRQAAVEGSLRARKYLRRRKVGMFLKLGLICTHIVAISPRFPGG